VWNKLFQRGRLSACEHVLGSGDSGGIGITAIQLAKIIGSYVYVTAGYATTCELCMALGSTEAVNYNAHEFEDVLNSQRIDVILDIIGGAYFEKNIRILRDDGRLVNINAVDGARVTLNIMRVMQKRLSGSGSTLRNRDIEFKSSL